MEITENRVCSTPPPQQKPEAEFSGKEPYAGFQILYHKLWEYVDKNYYDKNALKNWKSYEHAFDNNISTISDLDLALKKMAESLSDRYTFYASAQEIKEASEKAKHKKHSGLDLYKEDKHFEVDSITLDSPAYKSKLKENDRVRCVDNIEIDKLTNKEVAEMLWGRPGSKLEIVAVSKETGKEYISELSFAETTKAEIEAKLLPGNNLYVRFPTFVEERRASEYANLAAFVERVSEKIRAAGGQINGLLLDLRNNLGGDTEEAIMFASLFLQGENTSIAKLVPKEGPKDRKVIADDKLIFQGKTVDKELLAILRSTAMAVLINGSTASSAELLTGALKDNKRAFIVGETSFGKGVGFKITTGMQGGNLSVTNLKYLTPSGYELHGKGIEPDLFVRQDRGAAEDEQLRQAIQILKQANRKTQK